MFADHDLAEVGDEEGVEDGGEVEEPDGLGAGSASPIYESARCEYNVPESMLSAPSRAYHRIVRTIPFHTPLTSMTGVGYIPAAEPPQPTVSHFPTHPAHSICSPVDPQHPKDSVPISP